MDKDNSYYAGETVYFATKHGKEKILAPLFYQFGMFCERVDVDTDEFGTFSGEVERTGSIRETLRKKVHAAAQANSNGRLFLASEGSFGPDPFVGILQTDLESLLLWDRVLGLEIYAEFLCRAPVHAQAIFGPRDDFRAFLGSIDFPRHSVIVHPEETLEPIFKGLKTERDVGQAMLESFWSAKNKKVIVATDLRADQNLTRRNAIAQAGYALIQKLTSLCPNCSLPGFAISRGVPGLRCECCGEASQNAQAVILECLKCGHAEEKPRPDGRLRLPVEICEYCNP